MVSLTHNPEVIEKWFQLSIQEQISNIGSEVLRADRWKQRGNQERMRTYYDTAVSFLCLSIRDPKNAAGKTELNLCIDELADYFIGENLWGTTSETLQRYYNAFL